MASRAREFSQINLDNYLTSESLNDYAPINSPSFTGTVSFPSGSASAPSISASGDANTGIFFPSADTLALSEGGIEAMRIDSSGRITMPYQPLFHAYGSGSQSWSGTATRKIVNLSNTYANIGNHFNTSTYKFTAPIAGTYLLFGRATTSTATASGPALFIDINNGGFAPEVAINYTNASYSTFGGMLIRQLSANDTVQLSITNYNNVSFTVEQGRCSLSGFLIG